MVGASFAQGEADIYSNPPANYQMCALSDDVLGFCAAFYSFFRVFCAAADIYSKSSTANYQVCASGRVAFGCVLIGLSSPTYVQKTFGHKFKPFESFST